MKSQPLDFTGHRNIPIDKVELVKTKLREEIEKAIADGFTMFITGMAEGVDYAQRREM